MAFPDFPFNEKLRSFVTHRHVLSYLQDYAKRFNLLQYVQVTTIDYSLHGKTDCAHKLDLKDLASEHK